MKGVGGEIKVDRNSEDRFISKGLSPEFVPSIWMEDAETIRF